MNLLLPSFFCLAADGKDALSNLAACALMAGGAWGGRLLSCSAQTGLVPSTGSLLFLSLEACVACLGSEVTGVPSWHTHSSRWGYYYPWQLAAGLFSFRVFGCYVIEGRVPFSVTCSCFGVVNKSRSV